MQRLGIVALAFSLGACASITSESTQLVRVDAVATPGGASVTDATCIMTNDKGTFEGKAPGPILVRKSAQNLSISCKAPSQASLAEGSAVSRAGAGMFGNILFGGGIGAIIDHNKGTAYNYPDWMRVEFGKMFTFDRTDHQDGQPTPGVLPVANGTAPVVTAAQ